jgi:hypothetical protein
MYMNYRKPSTSWLWLLRMRARAFQAVLRSQGQPCEDRLYSLFQAKMNVSTSQLAMLTTGLNKIQG